MYKVQQFLRVLSKARLASSIAKCTWLLTLFSSLILLTSCGGGGGGQTTPPNTDPVTITLVPSVDSSLQSTGALTIAKTMTTVETKPIGNSVTAQGGEGSVVYAVDGAGNIALAAYITKGRATFSAEGTVLAFGSTVLGAASSNKTLDQLQFALRSADGFAVLVRDVKAAVISGKNPLDQSAIQHGFDRVLLAAAGAIAQTQAERAQPQAVAASHAEASYEPSVLETALFKVTIANKYVKVPKFDSKVFLRNKSTLFFTASLVDLAGHQRESKELEGGASVIPNLPVELEKRFAGSFSVRLLTDDDKNKAELVKSALGLVPIFGSDCIGKFSTLAAKKVVDVYFNVTPIDWLREVTKDAAWTAVSQCALPYVASETVAALIKAYSKVTKVVGFARLAADRELLPNTIPDTGVCLSENQYQISCVASITATAINPMMPDAVQPIDIKFIGEDGKKTLAPPYGLDIKYSKPGLFEISSTFTQVIANDLEGVGDVTMTDPATDKALSLRVTVTNGKLDHPDYTVPVGGSTTMKLIDPVTGAEVYRNPATFDIFLSDSKYGTFSESNRLLGGISFKAENLVTSTPLPILFRSGNSGSTLSVGGESHWEGSLAITGCTKKPVIDEWGVDVKWFWEVPCQTAGFAQYSNVKRFFLDENSGDLTMEQGAGQYAYRKVFKIKWNPSDDKIVLSMPTRVIFNLYGQDITASYTGSRDFEFLVNSRTSTTISGTFTVRSLAGIYTGAAFLPGGFKFIDGETVGTWSADLVGGPAPVVRLNGFDVCYNVPKVGGANYWNLDKLIPLPVGTGFYDNLSIGSEYGDCVFDAPR